MPNVIYLFELDDQGNAKGSVKSIREDCPALWGTIVANEIFSHGGLWCLVYANIVKYIRISQCKSAESLSYLIDSWLRGV